MTKNTQKIEEDLIDEITYLPSRSGNKTLYLVTVEDPTVRAKKRVFVTKYIDQKAFGIDFIGYEIDNKTSGRLTDKDAVLLANKGNKDLISILFPWNRVISIRNASYMEAKHIKNTLVKQSIIEE